MTKEQGWFILALGSVALAWYMHNSSGTWYQVIGMMTVAGFFCFLGIREMMQ